MKYAIEVTSARGQRFFYEDCTGDLPKVAEYATLAEAHAEAVKLEESFSHEGYTYMPAAWSYVEDILSSAAHLLAQD